jgi:hypothetical protein
MAGMMSSDRDPARVALASAIALHAGAVRDWQVAEQAAELAERRHWEAQSALDELHKAVAPTSGALADEFISSVASGAPLRNRVLIVADRGFGDQKLYRVLTEELKFDYLIRFRGNIAVTSAEGETRPLSIEIDLKRGRYSTLRSHILDYRTHCCKDEGKTIG